MKSTFTLTLILLLVSLGASAQVVIKGQRTIGGFDYDDLTSMEATKDGGFILGGISSSGRGADKTERKKGGADYWIVKLGKNGKTQWDKTIGGGSDDYLQYVKPTTDGGYILGGNSYSKTSGDKSEDRHGSSMDFWVVKLDSAGNKEWDKTMGGIGTDEVHGLVQAKDGGYLVGGWSGSGIGFEKTQPNLGCWDYWVVKLDATGHILWDKTIGGTGCDDLGAIDATSDGGFILCGYSESGISFDKTGTNRGSFDYWAVKLDSAGNILWDKTYGGSSDDRCVSTRQTADKGFLFSGYSYSGASFEKTEPSFGEYDYWFIKTDSVGNITWNKTIGSGYSDMLTDARQTSDGGYIACGNSPAPASGLKTENSRGGQDYWVVKLNANGNFVTDKTIGGSADDFPFSVLEKGGDYMVGGSSPSPVSGDKTDSIIGADDYWIVRLGMGAGSIVNAAAQESIMLKQSPLLAYPNPVKDILQLSAATATTVTITDQAGKVWLTKIINGNAAINVGNLPAGLYYVTDKRSGKAQKILIVH